MVLNVLLKPNKEGEKKGNLPMFHHCKIKKVGKMELILI